MSHHNVIRKISNGADYKNDAMYYATGQEVWGGHWVHAILFDEADSSYSVFIQKEDEIMPWKKFNSKMAISVEYNLSY